MAEDTDGDGAKDASQGRERNNFQIYKSIATALGAMNNTKQAANKRGSMRSKSMDIVKTTTPRRAKYTKKGTTPVSPERKTRMDTTLRSKSLSPEKKMR